MRSPAVRTHRRRSRPRSGSARSGTTGPGWTWATGRRRGTSMQLERGDVAVVTGAASGIGFALAERFVAGGLRVVAADIEPGALDDAVARLAEHSTDVVAVPTDVSS